MPEPAARIIPPPLVYAGTLLATSLFDRAVSLRLPNVPARRGVGIGLVVAGMGLASSGAALFRRNHTTIIPGQESSSLVAGGPYTYTRNPMYLGMTVAYTGGALLAGSWWSFIALPAVVGYIDRNVIRHEEAQLRKRFGAEYDEFCRHTRRWI